ncbi:MAG: HD domain-containing protein [Candidatus Nitrosotenuis sp.]
MCDIKRLTQYVKKRIQNDPAHDFDHIMRVCRNAKKIAINEKADICVVLAAALLHDIVSFPKHDARSKTSSSQSAIEAKKILPGFGYSKKEIDIICDAIKNHSYSKKKTPKTLEGKILQDADRLDALGAIGIARTFVVGGSSGRLIYNEQDPFCKNRVPDDKMWTVDHFYKKLLVLEKNMHTELGKKIARKRTAFMKKFLAQLAQEV